MTLSLLGLTAILAMVYLIYIRRHTPLAPSEGELPLDASPAPASFLTRHQWMAHRSTFLNFSLVFTLCFVSLAFEYASAGSGVVQAAPPEPEPEVEIRVVRTPAQQPPQLPPPPPAAPLETFTLTDVIELVELDQASDAELQVEFPAPSSPRVQVAAPPPPPPPAPPLPPPVIEPEVQEIFKVVEEMPRFPSCEEVELSAADRDRCAAQALQQFISNNFSVPALARENGVEGKAYVMFIVEPDGAISSAEVVRDPGAGIGREALRVVNRMPTWVPGRQRGKAVRVQFVLPFKVTLQ